MELPKRKQNRLKDYDYSQNGAYFITICTQHRLHTLSKIETFVRDGFPTPHRENTDPFVGDGFPVPFRENTVPFVGDGVPVLHLENTDPFVRDGFPVPFLENTDPFVRDGFPAPFRENTDPHRENTTPHRENTTPFKKHIVLTNFGDIVMKYINLIHDKYPTVCVDKYVIMPNHIHLIVMINSSGNKMQNAHNGGEGNFVEGGTGILGSRTEILGSRTEILGSRTEILGSGTEILGNGTEILGSGTEISGSGTEILGSGTGILGSGTGILGSGTGNPSPTIGMVMGWFKYQTTKSVNEINKNMGNRVWQRSFHDHVIRHERAYRKIWDYIDTNVMFWEKDCFYEL